jgi:hypothetical protein
LAVEAAFVLVGLSPWLAWAGLAVRRQPATDEDRLWWSFRDHFGAIWGLRLREQFNRSAANAGWPSELGWSGMRQVGSISATAQQREAAHAALAALMKRFGLA